MLINRLKNAGMVERVLGVTNKNNLMRYLTKIIILVRKTDNFLTKMAIFDCNDTPKLYYDTIDQD